MNLIICGPPFTGKTTLGKQAAFELNWLFRDMDLLIEKAYFEERKIHLTCREIYRKEGEAEFRRFETHVITSLLGCKKYVFALGGGCLQKVENVLILKQLGSFIYLKTPLKVLKERLSLSPLPAYLEKTSEPLSAYEKLLNERCAIYEKYADKIIDTEDLSQTEIVSIIVRTKNG